ncbi:cupin domain-containing protein [Thermoleophilia bacterium SCSIO 60948]|nr:cupin domain-containing protein [Thermoleophilia bacterium SCSIO 60948]
MRTENEETVVQASHRDPEIWTRYRGFGVRSNTLISRGLTDTRGMTIGTVEIEPGGELQRHSHPQAETYFVIDGTAEVETGDRVHRVSAGGAVHIPGDLPHACRNAGDTSLRFAYFFNTDSIDDVEYDW